MPTELVKSAARVFEILEVFSQEHRRLSAVHIGATLGYPRSSMNVLLKSMVAQGYLSYHSRDLTYFPTLKVTQLGDWLPSLLLGSDEMMSELERLRDRARETVTLAMSGGQEMRMLKSLVAATPIAIYLDAKNAFPMAGTAVGAAFLATLDDDSLRRLLSKLAASRSKREPLDIEAEFVAIAEVRERGYAIAFDGVTPGIGAIAMPLFPAGTIETLIVAIVGLSKRIATDEARLVSELRATVKRVSR